MFMNLLAIILNERGQIQKSIILCDFTGMLLKNRQVTEVRIVVRSW